MLKDDIKYLFSLVMMLVLLITSPSSCQFDNNELANSELKAYLKDVLGRSKEVKKTEHSPLDNMQSDQETNASSESAYERVIRNLRANWEMPVNYLQHRGYLTKSDSNVAHPSNDHLSMDAINLINGPLLNPSTFKNVYPIPQGPNSVPSIKTERSDKSVIQPENNGVNNGAERRSYSEFLRDCNNPSMFDDLACLEQYLGEDWVKSAKVKWNSWFNKNQTANITTATTTNSPTTTTTNSPTTLSTSIPNITTEVISDLSIQDARDSLAFFKIYNDFMLSKLASKLSQDAHERQMFNSAQNSEQNNVPEIVQNPTQSPDFSRINEYDIKVLKELDSCLKNKKNLTKFDGYVPMTKPVIEATNEVTDDRQVSNTYLPTKLKFLAHLHHEVFDIGNVRTLSKDQSTVSANLNGNDCNVDITNSTYSFTVK